LVLIAALGLSLCGLGKANQCAAAEPPKPVEPVFPFPIQRSVLDNGLTLLSVPYDSPGTISYYTIVRTGSRNEVEPGLSGFAHFFEHMMFRGTAKYSGDLYNSILKKFGADSNAFTTDDWTCYHITASAGALETIVELEADRFQNLSYDEAGFQKEARAVLGEYNKIASSPLLPLEEKLQDLAFDKHTYKHTTIGFLKDIVDMPNQYQYSLKFLERWYRPDNCIVLVVGDVKHGQLVQLAQRHYGPWKRGAAELKVPIEPPQTAERRATLPWKAATLPHLMLGYHVPAFDPNSSDVAALDILSEAVFAKTSPLYRKLVLEEGKAEEIMAGATFHRDPTLLNVLVRVRDVADMPAVEAAVYAALEDAAAKPISAERLRDIQSHLRYGLVLNSTDAVATALGNYLQLTGNADALNQIYASYARVTPADVQRVAAKYFAPANRTVVTLSSDKDMPVLENQSAERAAKVTAKPVAAKQSSGASAPKKLLPIAAAKPVDTKAAPAPSSLIAKPARPTQVALRVAFRAGAQDDPPGKEGLAALTARLVSEGGYGDVTYEQLLEKLYPLAAEIGGDCDKELTAFTGSVHPDNLAAFARLLGRVLLKPRFGEADFERIRQEHIS
jgi:zinc protease